MSEPLATLQLQLEAGNIGSQLVREMAKTSKMLDSMWIDAAQKGMKIGLRGSELDNLFSKAAAKAVGILQEAKDIMAKAAAADAPEEKKRLLKEAEAKRKIAHELFDSETKHTRSIIDRRWKAHKKAEEYLSKGASERAGSLLDAFSKLKGGDVKGFGSAAGSAAQIGAGMLGKGAGAAGAAAASGGAGAGALAGAAGAMSAAAGTIAAIAAPIAIIAGTLAVIVKLMIDANNQAKEMNKAFLNNAGAGDMMFKTMDDGTEQLGQGLQDLRAAATDFVHNIKWGTVSDEMAKILTSANEAGLTYKEMASDTSQLVNGMKGYLGVTEVALRYSKLLGEDAGTLAANLAEWEHDLGGGLRTIEESFASVTKIAMESGFNVKRFYSMVQQATSGMALYNVRVSEAANLLKITGKILGEEEATDFLKTMQKGFEGQGFEDQLKTIAFGGGDNWRQAFDQAFAYTSKDFADKFGPQVQDAMKSLDLGELDMSNPEAFLKGLKDMDSKSRDQLVAKLTSMPDSAAGRKIVDVLKLGDAAASGNYDDMQDALSHLNASTVLAGKMVFPAMKMFGKPLHDLKQYQKDILVQTGQMDQGSMKQMELMSQTMHGDFVNLTEGNRATQEEAAKKLGWHLDEQGRILDKDNAEVQIEGFADYVMKVGQNEEDTVAAMSLQEALAQSTVEHTRDMSNILQNGVQFMLEKIYTLMESIYNAYMGLSDDDKKVKAEALAASEQQMEILSKGQVAAAKQLDQAKMEAREAGQKVDTDPKVIQAQEDLAKITATMKAEGRMQRELGGLGGKGLAEQISTGSRGYGSVEAMRVAAGSKVALTEMSTADREAEAARGNAEYDAGERGGNMGPLTPGMRAAGYDWMSETGRSMMGVSEGDQASIMAASTSMNPLTRMGGGLTSAKVATQNVVGAGMAGLGDLQSYMNDWDASFREQAAIGEKQNALGQEGVDLAMRKEAADEKARLEAAKEARDKAKADGKLLKATKDQAAEIVKEEKKAELVGAIATGQLTGVGAEDYQSLMSGDMDIASMARLSQRINTESPALDFVYRGGAGGGTITPINRADELLGMKPNGAIDQVFGGGGGGSMVNITINGGDEARVYATVKRALRSAGVS